MSVCSCENKLLALCCELYFVFNILKVISNSQEIDAIALNIILQNSSHYASQINTFCTVFRVVIILQ